MTLLKETVIQIRCAYCGLDHKLLIRAVKAKNEEVLIVADAVSDGCDVLALNYKPNDLVQ